MFQYYFLEILLQYTDNMLYTQMCFYQYLFDLDRAAQQLNDKRERGK